MPPDILPEGHGRDALDFSAPLSASLTEVGQNGFIFWGCFSWLPHLSALSFFCAVLTFTA